MGTCKIEITIAGFRFCKCLVKEILCFIPMNIVASGTFYFFMHRILTDLSLVSNPFLWTCGLTSIVAVFLVMLYVIITKKHLTKKQLAHS